MTYFEPVDPIEYEKGNQGYDVPDYCINCGNAFMDHKNGKCPKS